MAFDVPFGQYVAGDTPVHRLDARAKFVVLIALTVALFASKTWWALVACAVVVVVAYACARLSLKFAVRGLKPVLFLLILTILINAIGYVGTDALNIAGYGIKLEGLMRGCYFAFRIIILIGATSLLTYTTSQVELTDALVALMRPLAKLRVPVEDVAMMFSIALRFIPTTAEEAEKIVVAQSARGAHFDDKNLIKRLRAWIPVLIPLFVSLFRRADMLAVAMESRCYQGEGRTHLREYSFVKTDIVVMVLSPLVAVVLILFW